MIFPLYFRPAALAVLGVVSTSCVTPGLDLRLADLRRQVDQIAAQRDRLDTALRAVAEARGGSPPQSGRPDGPEAGGAEPIGVMEIGVLEETVVLAAAGPIGPGAPAAIEEYRRGYVLFQQGEFDQAEDRLRQFLAAAPAHPAAADARYWIGECYFARAQFREAIGVWRPVGDSGEAADRPDRALVRMGTAFARLGEIEMARAAFRRALDDWPEGDAAPTAREAIDHLPPP